MCDSVNLWINSINLIIFLHPKHSIISEDQLTKRDVCVVFVLCKCYKNK